MISRQNAKRTAEITEHLSTALADRYRIERRFGDGGMATVYLAEDLKHCRMVAPKVLRPEIAKGVATRALSAFLHVVTDRPLHAHVVKHNVGSIRVLEKCGFSVEERVEVASDGVVELVLVLR